MRKYKLKKSQDKKIPSPEEIKEFKDFKKITANYHKIIQRPEVPLYKNPKAFLGLFLIVIVLYLITLAQKEENGQKELPKTEQKEKS